ncbi:sulfite exporter TauE/SafE family protein [Aliifodinibius sp. S!AR15-10]|uniref:sulfite exporter TauE/SafE family protein n=1 Tax=Aliifodinibius sp. S!AR15-10 TaxID=2950437 RepID=UPI0028567B76|nr:sulfite exporter TauE/SafE family protein [Aliifodinibius sp. S!AR15-10]MDR8393628.1 sulfite exporter TauE/SafE family protein [Aliifodinibius sp. S!AR15-10]
MPIPLESIFTEEVLLFILIGFIAQLIDGTLGMAYGISTNTFLISIGISPVQASASIHIAEVATTFVSGISHYGFGNVDIELVKKLILPGMIGAMIGALVLVWLPMQIMKTAVGMYLLVMGGYILYKAIRKSPEKKVYHHTIPLGFFGGFFDSSGGGGWGTIVASTLVAKGSIPRLAVGTVNFAEFFIALTSSLTFVLSISMINWRIILGLALGGALAAPFSAYFARHIPARAFSVLIGITIMLLSGYTLYKAIS